MIRRDFAECAIIGGAPEQRLQFAIVLRRREISCFTELHQSKRKSMIRRACADVKDGMADVYDIDDPYDREYLQRPNAFRENAR